MARFLALMLLGCGTTSAPTDAFVGTDAGPAVDLSAPLTDGGIDGTVDAFAPGNDASVEPPILRIPVVVHVLHRGEPLGSGPNLSTERVVDQIERTNDDLRRRGRGANDHPAGADAGIELVLARIAPDGSATDGIHRVDISAIDNPVPPSQRFDFVAHYGYWDHARYLNVWTEPLDESFVDIVLGSSTGPALTFPGSDLLLEGEPAQAEGILINAFHFGEGPEATLHDLGRTLTHELGHYLGLLHPWGGGDCADNDFLEDTPPVIGPHMSCPATPPMGCAGIPAMVANYMDYTPDACMNLFTRDQVARMRRVLQTSPERVTLLTSPGL